MTPQHLYKPDGRRYPDTRPDGLVRQGQLIKLLGIGESTFLRWQERGFITPVKREGHCTLYVVPTAEEVQSVRERIQRSKHEGSALGGHNTAKRGASPAGLDHARQVHIDAATARREAGLLNKGQMAAALGVCSQTLVRWIYQGHVAPVLRRGQHSYFAAPDEALRASLLEVAVGRSRTQLALEPSQRVAQPEGTLSMQEMQALVGVSDSTMNTWIKRGLLPPCVARGQQNAPYFLPPTQEQIEHARAVMASNIKTGNKTGGANSLGKGWHGAPEGLLTIPGAAHRLGVTAPCVRRRIAQGYIATVEGRWIAVEELERYIAAGCPHSNPGPVKSEPVKPKKPSTPPTNPRQKPSMYTPPVLALKPFVPEMRPTALNGRALPPPLPSGYEEAVKVGRDDPRFNSVLGFNLLVCRSEGFRVAPVNEKPDGGWRYHERHHLNGYRQWQVKAQRPLTGEILL